MPDGDNFNVTIDPDTGDVIIDERTSGQTPSEDLDSGHFDNLVPLMDPTDVDAICASLTTRLADDEKGQAAFKELMAEHVRLLGAGPESDPDDYTYEASDTSDHPLLLTAMTRFQSKATAAIMPAPNKVCRAVHNRDLGNIPDVREKQKVKTMLRKVEVRVEDFYTDYLFRRDQTYKEDTDRIVWESGLHGIGIRKIYNDMSRSRNKTRIEWVPIQNMLFSYDSRSTTRGRISQKIDMPTSDLIRMIRSGQYVADDIVTAVASEEADDPLTEEQDRIAGISPSTGTGSTHRIYEVNTDLFLSIDMHPDGLARPYLVTIHAPSQKIVSIKRNWQQSDPEEKRIESYVAYIYSPGKTANQGLGLGHLIGGMTRALRKAQRRALDAAYLQNMPFGYKLSNMSIRNGSSKIIPGEMLDVDSPTDDIRGALQMNMFQGPSGGLLNLMERMENAGRELGGIATMDFGQLMKSQIVAPVLAALEEASEFQTSVHFRLYDAQETEMRLLHDRMQEVYANKTVVYGADKVLQAGDLLSVDLVPMMKPGFVSKQKTLIEAQALKEAAAEAPDVIDRRKAQEEYVRALGRTDIDDFIIPPPEEAPPPQPKDALSEYTMILAGQPVAAGLTQNHQAHIDTHTAQMRMIEVSQMSVDDGDRAMAALAAHIVEHYSQMMLVDVASRMGVDPTIFAQGIPPELEGQLALAIAEATAAVEAERRPPEPREESKAMLEQIKQRGKLTETEMKQRHDAEQKDLDRRHAIELQKLKDEAETERQDRDDDTALEIARMKASGEAGPQAGNKAGVSAG